MFYAKYIGMDNLYETICHKLRNCLVMNTYVHQKKVINISC